jgi:hypothetical protein
LFNDRGDWAAECDDRDGEDEPREAILRMRGCVGCGEKCTHALASKENGQVRVVPPHGLQKGTNVPVLRFDIQQRTPPAGYAVIPLAPKIGRDDF